MTLERTAAGVAQRLAESQTLVYRSRHWPTGSRPATCGAGFGQRRPGGESSPPPPTGRRSDEIDYEIFGSEMQYVEVTLDPGEMVIAEAGAMMYMTTGHPDGDGVWRSVGAAGRDSWARWRRPANGC